MYKIAMIVLGLVLLGGAAKVTPVTMKQLQATTQKNDDTLYVVNFWATWCKPCVGEIPYFQNADQKFAGQKVKVVFVSLNSVKEADQVDDFVKQKQIKQNIYLLNAGNPNNWIDTVDYNWSGAIPATAMYKNGKKVYFREGEFTQQLLDSIILTKNK